MWSSPNVILPCRNVVQHHRGANFTSPLRFAVLFLMLRTGENGPAADGNTGWVGYRVLDKPDFEECATKTSVGDSLYVEYEVMIDEESQGKGKTLEFKLGTAPVNGWDQHLVDMCVDEERELTIPPSTHGHRNIGMADHVPKDAVLKFNIRLLDINGEQRKAQYARSKARAEKAKQRAESASTKEPRQQRIMGDL